jgi:hypothetical protein
MARVHPAFQYSARRYGAAGLPDNLRQTFLAMRAGIEAGRPIAEIGDAR